METGAFRNNFEYLDSIAGMCRMPGGPPVIVIGAGASGLCCARRLHFREIPFLLLEAEDGPGGRVRTDIVDGFRLDRGFQVLLTAYPEAQRQLDYTRLHLRRFTPGAMIRRNGRFRKLVDPWRRPSQAMATAVSGVGSLADKLRIGRLRHRSTRGDLNQIWSAPETTTLEALRRYRFSEEMIDAFFRPFLGGVFLERKLDTSSRMLHFVFRMFSLGDAALPADGIGAIPEQLAENLPADCVRYNTRVERIDDSRVELATGESLEAASVVIATNGRAAASLLHREFENRNSRNVACVYFATPTPPIEEPILVLNGDGEGPVNNMCVTSRIAPETAPAGRHLVSASVISNPMLSGQELEAAVRGQMHEWFGAMVNDWRYLRTYRIRDALPNQAFGRSPFLEQGRIAPGLYVCGDVCAGGSLQAAMESGRNVADQVIRDFAADS